MMNRRTFLRGAGGATLALPLLPSLFGSDKAYAAALAGDRCFVGFTSSHGCRRGDMFPGASVLTETLSAGGHSVRRGNLVRTVSGATASVSPVLAADASVLTAELVGKMNVLQGLDMTWNMDHHYGMAAFGNLAQSISFPDDAIATNTANQRRSIDQVMAWSPTFYPSLSGVQERAITLGFNNTISWGYSNPAAATGRIQAVEQRWSSSDLFRALFPTPPSVPSGTPLVDLVVENYNRVRSSNRRLSAADRTRLDEHMERMSELQRRLRTVTTCGDLPASVADNDSMYGYAEGDWYTSPDKHVGYFQLNNEVLAMGLACGATRVAVINQNYPTSFADQEWNDFHDRGPGHGLHDSEALGQGMAAMKRRYFSGVVLDLARRLEAIAMGDGTTGLDRALVLWADEHGDSPHSSISIPAITFGSAGGFLKTGNYCDYRNLAGGGEEDDQPGLTYQQLMGTCLQAMGVAHAEWAEPDHGGYGKRINGGNGYSAGLWPDSVWGIAGDVLPFLEA